ncbi:uncharacterized protein HHUB_1736 [Halobacterium hubeiense]|uniref:Uncharacterized protein n=1 Tax=Halobacterium hubeiense TaxID=1407499 RepID=A0A0U5H162_9EURY|nr:hypothetical protein [Halobacterium hubeiense]CQH51477.1 uncharacterized protein HHUB_1736 [Halobacterium hubeiense]
MSPTRIADVALLVAVAGCAGLAPTGSETAPTTAPTATPTETTSSDTTAPHTGVGTSHSPEHLTVRASAGVENATVTLAPDGDAESYEVPAGREVDLTREIHDRGHDVHVIVERGGEVVYEADVLGYEHHRVTVNENDTDVSMAVV